MSKFNVTDRRTAARSPITTEPTATGQTHEGAPGYARDVKSELFLLAVSNMVGERTFYESADDRDDRYETLVRACTSADPDWTAAFLRWLRGEGDMRSASLVGAALFAHERLAQGKPGMSRQAVDSVLQRADEPGEMLAFWAQRFGRAVPKPVKRGVADAVRRLYNERSLLKYDGASKGYRFADVLELVHPTPAAEWQGDLFRYALDRRHDRGNPIPERLEVIRRNAILRAAEDPPAWLDADQLRAAGMTWEDAQSAIGSKVAKGRLWEALIPSMGYMALLRNLRNFDETGVSDKVAATVAARLADPEQVAKSRQLPMRFLSAYRNAPSLRWSWALEQALVHCLGNVPALPGRTLVLVDRSGSMFWDRLSARSDLTRADGAAIFGTALARRCDSADLVQFGTGSAVVPFRDGESVLPILKRFSDMGGTDTERAVRAHYAQHHRVVIVTDEQAHAGGSRDVTAAVPQHVPVYTWNLAGYERGHAPSGSGTRHTFGGLSDAAFRMIPLLEAGQNAAWPWE